MSTPPRFAPEQALPPYGFVPTCFPHPVRDPDGHSFGRRGDFGPPPDPGDWRADRRWRYLLDLFNHGYYWEAHEGLEAWWHQADPGGPLRPFFQGLLRLAAAGVKARQGLPAGVHSHATRAAALLRQAAELLSREKGLPRQEAGLDDLDPSIFGLRPLELADAAERIALRARTFRRRTPLPPAEAVLGLELLPRGLA